MPGFLDILIDEFEEVVDGGKGKATMFEGDGFPKRVRIRRPLFIRS